MTESVGTVEDRSHRRCDGRSSPDKPAHDAGSAPEPPAPPSLPSHQCSSSLGMFEVSRPEREAREVLLPIQDKDFELTSNDFIPEKD